MCADKIKKIPIHITTFDANTKLCINIKLLNKMIYMLISFQSFQNRKLKQMLHSGISLNLEYANNEICQNELEVGSVLKEIIDSLCGFQEIDKTVYKTVEVKIQQLCQRQNYC